MPKPVYVRDEEALLASGLAVIDAALAAVHPSYRPHVQLAPLFSGGHDSYCACRVAAAHPRFDGAVYHIDTGIGSRATREFVEAVCRDEGWTLRAYRSNFTYRDVVRTYGFPGPGMHGLVYTRIKDRAVRQITRGLRRNYPTVLVTGCRSQESVRRMGHVAPVKVGEALADGSVREKHRVWTAPCHDWSTAEQRAFMDAHALPRNPVKRSPLGMSGECFCGAFARPGELDMIRAIVPDVAEEIDRCADIARAAGKPCVWGTRPPGKAKGVLTVEAAGPLCSTCDLKAAAAGLNVVPRCGGDSNEHGGST